MNFNQIKELIDIIENSSFNNFELRFDGSYVKISKNMDNSNSNICSPVSLSNSSVVPDIKNTDTTIISENISAPITIIPHDKVELKEGNIVKAPVVGTFYESSSPSKPPFVKVGDKVKEGDILCIIEAMKIMNEIKSQYSGEIAEILVQNEDMVEYNQPLFRIV